MKTWQDCKREDLNLIPLAESLGWSVKFSTNDERFNRTSAENCPHDCVSFKKGNIVTWKFYKRKTDGLYSYWQVAYLINKIYTNHQPHNELEEVLRKF